MKDNKNSLNVAKIGMVGDSQVGKTSICYTFIGVEFSTESQQTIGAEKFDKKIILKNKKEVKLFFGILQVEIDFEVLFLEL